MLGISPGVMLRSVFWPVTVDGSSVISPSVLSILACHGVEVEPDEVGLHVVARLAPELAARMDDRAAEARAAAAGLAAPALSSFYLGAPGDGACRDGAGHDGACRGGPCGQGLLLGYAAVAEPEIEKGIETLARALEGTA